MALSNRAITNLYDEEATNQVGLVLSLDEKEKLYINYFVELGIPVKVRKLNLVIVCHAQNDQLLSSNLK